MCPTQGFWQRVLSRFPIFDHPLGSFPRHLLQLPSHLLLQEISGYRRRRCSTPSSSARLFSCTPGSLYKADMRSRRKVHLTRRPRHSAHELNEHVPYQSREVPGLANIVRLANQYVEVHSTRVHVPLIHPMTGLHCCCCPTAFESMISLGRLHEFERPFQRYSS